MSMVRRLLHRRPSRGHHFHLHRTTSTTTSTPQSPLVGIFWDLDNKPPNSTPPSTAAARLRSVAAAFGRVLIFSAFANSHAFRHVPSPVLSARAARRHLDLLEDSGDITPCQPYNCQVCGRNFYKRSSLVHHFRELHEREQAKRLARLNSAHGARRVSLAAKLNPKIEKFNRAAPDVLTPRIGYGLADELRRSGVRVYQVSDRPEAADRELRDKVVEEMGKGRIKCLVIVSDDKGFTGVIREARARCLKTVVVGDEGELRRCAEAAFSWKDVVSGKAKKEAASAVGKWRDREIIKKLEWRFDESDKADTSDEFECEGGEDWMMGLEGKIGDGPWWELSSETEESVARSDGF